MKSSIKLQFSSQECNFKAILTFTKSVHAMFLYFFMLTYNDVFKTTQNNRQIFFLSSINLIHLYNSRLFSSYHKKRLVKNVSFMNFWFVESGNRLVIHESRTLNSYFVLAFTSADIFFSQVLELYSTFSFFNSFTQIPPLTPLTAKIC